MRIAVLVLVLAGCRSTLPPPRPDPGDGFARRVVVPADEPPPQVVRRLVAEDRDLVARDLALAHELPDPAGRARAEAEAETLARDLAEATAPLPSEDSAALDRVLDGLARVHTRAELLHESLRAATGRVTALATP